MLHKMLIDLQERRNELISKMYALEMGDDMLFSNANNNLPTYRAWEIELKRIEIQIREIKDNAIF